MAEPLSPADRSSLAAEQGPVTMAVGGVLSYDSGVHSGLLADGDLDPPLAAMHAALEEAIAELLEMFAPPARG